MLMGKITFFESDFNARKVAFNMPSVNISESKTTKTTRIYAINAKQFP